VIPKGQVASWLLTQRTQRGAEENKEIGYSGEAEPDGDALPPRGCAATVRPGAAPPALVAGALGVATWELSEAAYSIERAVSEQKKVKSGAERHHPTPVGR
jgi:hypothetical protein